MVKEIFISAYDKKMAKCIKKHECCPMGDTLIALLDEAAKWSIKNEKVKGRKKANTKRRVARKAL